jgi:hypothetical protein
MGVPPFLFLITAAKVPSIMIRTYFRMSPIYDYGKKMLQDDMVIINSKNLF